MYPWATSHSNKIHMCCMTYLYIKATCILRHLIFPPPPPATPPPPLPDPRCTAILTWDATLSLPDARRIPALRLTAPAGRLGRWRAGRCRPRCCGWAWSRPCHPPAPFLYLRLGGSSRVMLVLRRRGGGERFCNWNYLCNPRCLRSDHTS